MNGAQREGPGCGEPGSGRKVWGPPGGHEGVFLRAWGLRGLGSRGGGLCGGAPERGASWRGGGAPRGCGPGGASGVGGSGGEGGARGWIPVGLSGEEGGAGTPRSVPRMGTRPARVTPLCPAGIQKEERPRRAAHVRAAGSGGAHSSVLLQPPSVAASQHPRDSR